MRAMHNIPSSDLRKLASLLRNEYQQRQHNSFYACDVGLCRFTKNIDLQHIKYKALFANYAKSNPRFYGCNNYGAVKIDGNIIRELEQLSRGGPHLKEP